MGMISVTNLSGKSANRAPWSKIHRARILANSRSAIEIKTALKVERRFDLGGTLAHEALVAGEIDMYVEYTGTALLAILKGRPSSDPQEVFKRVKAEYANRFKLEWAEPLVQQHWILVRRTRKSRPETVSDAANFCAVARRQPGACLVPAVIRVRQTYGPFSRDPRDGSVADLPRLGRSGRFHRRQLTDGK
jgi:hypothetical protein